MHKKTAAVALLGVALLLAGCQSAPGELTGDGTCVPVAPGEASAAVQVTGGESAAPSVEFDGALSAYRTQRTVIEAGDGKVAGKGSLVTFAYAAFNGSSGEAIDAVGYDTPYSQVPLNGSSLLAGLEKSLLCTPGGSRIAAVIPPAEGFGEAGNERYGISPSDSVVVVIDLVTVAADRAEGERQAVMDNLPRVEVGATGEPQVTIPPKSPPTEYSSTVLKLGEGDPVTAGDTVTVEYHGVEWRTGRTFDSSWYRDDLVRMPTSNYMTSIGDALVGETVGSQLLVIIPPEFGFGEQGNRDLGIEANDTMVYVIDILAVAKPPTAPVEE